MFYDIQVRIETDPADRTQLRVTVASGDPTLTFEYVFIFPSRILLTYFSFCLGAFFLTADVQVEGVHQGTIS